MGNRMTVRQIYCEIRLIDRRCRCGKLLAELSEGCAWHPARSARYAADLLAYIDLCGRSTRSLRSRVVTRITTYLKGKPMNVYMFEYVHDGRKEDPVPIRATNAADAFDAFRADHPSVSIAYVWVDRFGSSK
jgi:hypothetical protein